MRKILFSTLFGFDTYALYPIILIMKYSTLSVRALERNAEEEAQQQKIFSSGITDDINSSHLHEDSRIQ
jgi:hypothetical protein